MIILLSNSILSKVRQARLKSSAEPSVVVDNPNTLYLMITHLVSLSVATFYMIDCLGMLCVICRLSRTYLYVDICVS